MWLRLIQAESLAPIDDVRPLLNEANELVAIFTTSVKRLRITLTAGLVCLTLVGRLLPFVRDFSFSLLTSNL